MIKWFLFYGIDAEPVAFPEGRKHEVPALILADKTKPALPIR